MSISHVSHRGLSLPAIGLGTYKLKGADGAVAIAEGLNLGYSLLDSAYNYENEGTVGEALRVSGLPRNRVLVTSKLPGRYQRREDARITVEESLYRLGLPSVDLYLIHWPNPAQGLYVEAFEALLQAREDGLISHVGVCNFLPEHLETLKEATGEYPEVNQIELHPYFPQTQALAFHRERGIITQAWSPLRRGGGLFEEPAVTGPALRLGVSPAEAVLAWHVAVGSLPIPKSSSPQRQLANLRAQDLVLTEAEVAAITALGREDGRMKNQDPAVYEEF